MFDVVVSVHQRETEEIQDQQVLLVPKEMDILDPQ